MDEGFSESGRKFDPRGRGAENARDVVAEVNSMETSISSAAERTKSTMNST